MKLSLPLGVLAAYPLGIFQSYLLGLRNSPTPTKVIPRYQKRTKSISVSPQSKPYSFRQPFQGSSGF